MLALTSGGENESLRGQLTLWVIVSVVCYGTFYNGKELSADKTVETVLSR